MSNSLWSQRLQHGRLPCPSPIPGACSKSRPSSRWCHPTISSSVVPFFSCPQSFPASGSFPMSQFFTSGGQSIGERVQVAPYTFFQSASTTKKKKKEMKSFSRVRLFATLWMVAYHAPPSMGFSRQQYWSGLPFPSPGNLHSPGIEPRFPALQADTLPPEPPRKPQHHPTGLSSTHSPQPASYFRVNPHVPAFLTRLGTSWARDRACSSSLYSLTENLKYNRQNY